MYLACDRCIEKGRLVKWKVVESRPFDLKRDEWLKGKELSEGLDWSLATVASLVCPECGHTRWSIHHPEIET